jgi:hypothetical protein
MTLRHAWVRRNAAMAAAFVALALWVAYAAGSAAERPPAGERPATLDDLDLRTVTEMGSREGDALRDWLVADADTEVRVGAELYDRNCAVCHGDTGLGLDEARLSFPADHRRCTRCHRPGNPAQMTFAQMIEREHDLFDIGRPPSLRGPAALAGFADPVSLWAYTGATMPRYQPGRLTATETRAVVTFLWHANGRDASAALDALVTVAPGPTPPPPPPIDGSMGQ